MKKHVLITGGAGFVGSHLCDLFLSRGYAVTAIDNLVTGRKSNLDSAYQHKDFDFFEWDICRPLEVRRLNLLEKYGLQGVLHFACPASPIDFDRIPFEILAVDSIGTMNTVELALKHQARYILASTSEIYGDPLVHPQAEDYWGNVNTLGPRACYDEAKRFAEAYVSTAIRGVGQHGGQKRVPLNGGIVRIFNTYGPRMRPDDGRIVPELCMQAIRGMPLTLHSDGKQTRSFCFVSDLVEGIFRLYESPLHVPVNIGNSDEYTVLDFAQTVGTLMSEMRPGQAKLEMKYLPGRPDDPKRRCPDISRAKKELQWEPKIGLQEGLSLTLKYFFGLSTDGH